MINSAIWIDFATEGKEKCIKTCKECGLDVLHNRTYRSKHTKSKNLRPISYCIVCMRKYHRDKRKGNKAFHTKQYLYKKNKKKTLVELKGWECLECGLKHDRFEVYDFHHRDPSAKLFSISSHNLVRHSLDKLKAEAEKCDLLCCLCHRIKHLKHRID